MAPPVIICGAGVGDFFGKSDETGGAAKSNELQLTASVLSSKRREKRMKCLRIEMRAQSCSDNDVTADSLLLQQKLLENQNPLLNYWFWQIHINMCELMKGAYHGTH